jgi:hypothetical protein
MTFGDVFVCLVAGLAVPLAILDAARTILDDTLPLQINGLQFERRALPWILALLAGPALLVDRVAEGWREGMMSRGDIAHGVVITLGWAGIYGFVMLSVTKNLFGI